MIRRVTSGALLAGTLLLPTGAARSEIVYETSLPIVAGSMVLPTAATVTSTPAYLTTSYVDDLLPTSYVPTSYVSTSDLLTTSYVPTAVTTYRSSIFRPRRYVERTSYYYAPRSVITPTSYYVPTTTYVRPTTYVAPTSYVVPTTTYVAPTSYVVPTTTYVPTTYAAPVLARSYTYDPGVVTTAYTPSACNEATTPLPATRVPPPVVRQAPATTDRQPSGAIQSTPAHEPGVADPPMNAEPNPVRVQPVDPGPATPVSPPSPTQQPEMPAPGQIAPRSSADASDIQTRNSLRPVYSVPGRVETSMAAVGRNVLRGRVLAYGSNLPEEGVVVYLTSRTGAFNDRTTMTNADGYFAVTLPDGDWAVKVRMPSGNVKTVTGEDVTATAGKIIDSVGRGVSEFVITR